MKQLIIAILFVLIPCQAFAWGGLTGQRVDGFDRYCFYSDGGALTVGSTDLCPISNQGSGGVIDMRKSFGFGSLADQRVNGFYRYCSYSNGAVLTVGSTDLCPVSSE